MELILNDENFEKEIAEAKLPVLVDFFAVWCGPCNALAPILEQVAKEMEGKIIVAKVNVDENPQVSQKFRIEKIPAVILFKQGRPESSFIGLSSAESIKSWIKNLI